MNHYLIEVIFDDDHELANVNLRGPGQYAQTYDCEESQPDLRTLLDVVANDIVREEIYTPHERQGQ